VRIGISLLELAPGEVGGSETYARSLSAALARVGRYEYRALVSERSRDAGGGLESTVASTYPAGRSAATRARALLAARASRRLRQELRLSELDGIHFPLTAMAPRVSALPAAVTVHDVQHLVLPRNFSRFQLLYRRYAYEGSARRARIVIAVSKHVRETLLERVGLPAERVVAVHSGVDHDRFSPPQPGSARQPFLLYPAFAWPHKNHGRLLAAFALLRRRHSELRLVLTGAPASAFQPQEGVEARGFVPPDTLVELYRTAAVLVFPSLYEGFGQPVLEAMACGCPVASSSAAALPEICNGTARLFDPFHPEAIAEAVEEVLARPAPWTERGLARAAAFSWEDTARATDDVYARLA
jgi:glycosyltransferase involved in cell wall biosynthesis